MANLKQAAAKKMKMAERAQHQLGLHFPDVPDYALWRRKSNDGYTTLPRTLPIVMQILDQQTKGQPAGHTLFCLWARSPDHPLVTIENPSTFAAEAGFKGQRAVDSWRRRMKSLQSLGMILTKPGASGDLHHVLLLNPNIAVEVLKMRSLVQQGVYGRFVDRLMDVGGWGEIEGYRALLAQQAAATQAQASGTSPAPVVAMPTALSVALPPQPTGLPSQTFGLAPGAPLPAMPYSIPLPATQTPFPPGPTALPNETTQ